MIKGLCVESGEGEAKLIFESPTPLTGRYYYLEDVTGGSSNQNKLFHALLTVFWDYMFETNTFIIEDNGVIYDLSSDCVASLKDLLKARHGKGFERYKYVNNNNGISSVDKFEDLPMYALEDFNSGNTNRINGVLISWADYSMPQRYKLITKVFLFMDLFGVDSKKYATIKEDLIRLNDERKAENRKVQQ